MQGWRGEKMEAEKLCGKGHGYGDVRKGSGDSQPH